MIRTVDMEYIQSSYGDGYWSDMDNKLLVRCIRGSCIDESGQATPINTFPAMNDNCIMRTVEMVTGQDHTSDDTRVRAIVLKSGTDALYMIPGATLGSYPDSMDDQLVTLCTEVIVDQMVYQYTQDVQQCMILLDSNT